MIHIPRELLHECKGARVGIIELDVPRLLTVDGWARNARIRQRKNLFVLYPIEEDVREFTLSNKAKIKQVRCPSNKISAAFEEG
jgi:hypothetical protein